jgi:hypothetical protein
MIRFRSEFLKRFSSKQRSDLNKFTSFVSALEAALGKSTRLDWPPPSDPRATFDYYIELIWQANAVRCANLCRGIVQNLNELNFLSFAVLFRALFENVLLARQYFHTRLLPIVNACCNQGQVNLEDLRSLVTELDTSVRRSKVDWDKILAGTPDHVADQGEAVWDKVSLKKASEEWDKAGSTLGALTPTTLYAVLCDLAHPNLGSALVCMKQDEFGFATPGHNSIGLSVFAELYPSLGAIITEFQRIQSALLLLKFDQELNL